jgi:hypothetical protein
MEKIMVMMKSKQINPEDRNRILARVYRLILSWSLPGDKNEEPDADNLGRDAASGSTPEQPTIVDSTSFLPSTQPKKVTRKIQGDCK